MKWPTKVVKQSVRILFALSIVGLSLALLSRAKTGPFAAEAGQGLKARLVGTKPWSVEPVKAIAAKNKKKSKIELDKAFDDDDDWLDGFTVTLINNSDKTVTAVGVDMIFRRDSGDTKPAVIEELHFGPHPMLPEYNLRDRRKVIRVGERIDLQLNSYNYKIMMDRLSGKGYTKSITGVELVIREVGFEDGSVLYSGTLFLQDPEHPDDPTKKIRADKLKPPGTLKHHTATSSRRTPVSKKSFLKANFATPNSRPLVDCCFQPDPPLSRPRECTNIRSAQNTLDCPHLR